MSLFLLVGLLTALGLITYAWVAFPLLLRVVSRCAVPCVPLGAQRPLPRVAVLLSAFNEEGHIGERVRNLLDLEYAPDRIVIFVGDDGSSDRTHELAVRAAADDPRVYIHRFAENRGKVAVLRDLVSATDLSAETGCDVLVFTDANTHFDVDAVRRLVSHFEDPAIGGVCGRLVFVDSAGAETDEGLYWRWETWLKTRESALDSCLGGNGAIYAIRRDLFWDEIPVNTIIDDFVIGMQVRQRGFRMVYDPKALGSEELPQTVRDEWDRRVRIGSGGFQALVLCRSCLAPRYGSFAWFFWSHKVLRWVTSHLLLLALLLAVPLSQVGQSWGQALGGLTIVSLSLLALVAAVGHWQAAAKSRLASVTRPLTYFCLMQAAIFAGFLLFCRGRLHGKWNRTARRIGGINQRLC